MRLKSIGIINIVFIVFIQKKYKELIPVFEKLPFKEKKDLLAELFLVIEHDEFLPDIIDGYEIARRILKY